KHRYRFFFLVDDHSDGVHCGLRGRPKEIAFRLKTRQGKSEAALRYLRFVGRPREHVKALLDEPHRFDAVDQSRRDISAGERGSTRRSRVNDLVVLWSQSLAPQ